MEAYRTEEEQIEAIRKFFNEFGFKIILIIVIGIASYFGYQFWQQSKQVSLEKSSHYYNELTLAMASGSEMTEENRAKFDEVFAKLVKEYPESLYASYASLLKAKLEVESSTFDKAEQSLRWVIDAKVNVDIVALANLRLARVLFAKGELDQALALLEKDPSPFVAAYEETKGDIYLEKNEAGKAATAYKKAKELRLEGSNEFTGIILDMKIASVDSVGQVKSIAADEIKSPANETKTDTTESK